MDSLDTIKCFIIDGTKLIQHGLSDSNIIMLIIIKFSTDKNILEFLVKDKNLIEGIYKGETRLAPKYTF